MPTNDVEHLQNQKNYPEIDICDTQDQQQPNGSKQSSNEPRRSQRSNRDVPSDRFVCIAKSTSENDPKNWCEINEMSKTMEKINWIKATKNVIDCLIKNETWTLVDLPPGKKIIGSKWTFTLKWDNQGKISKL